ncbi:hypothetical protein PMCNE_21120 [Pasteurella multocida]|nr:hypothetical protein ASV60_10240 [Pasteurella multocida]OBP34523.1 hypothetical protein A0R74_03375 [Pasteurella multocida subsp. multocida]TAA81284.1 hypothetical protein PMCNE_21120 [Pasteurella multocida]
MTVIVGGHSTLGIFGWTEYYKSIKMACILHKFPYGIATPINILPKPITTAKCSCFLRRGYKMTPNCAKELVTLSAAHKSFKDYKLQNKKEVK